MLKETFKFQDSWTDHEALRSLGSNLCPFCGKYKEQRNTFCNSDYFSLKPETRRALYKKIEKGYLESLKEAIKELKANDTQSREDNRQATIL